MYQRMLVPVDGSETARRGLDEAIKLSKALGASVRLVHIVDETPLAMNPETGIAAAPLVADFVEAGKQIIEEARAFAMAQGVEVATALHENFTGRVADRILEEARKSGAELIVMGTHGRRGIRHVVLGSDAEAVVRGATVPVLLVRAPGRK
ncbi:MAG TPA: universal stress protein [Burkholderiales bacterium]|nr:universal stress protein [Burkholderiales bacterium]